MTDEGRLAAVSDYANPAGRRAVSRKTDAIVHFVQRIAHAEKGWLTQHNRRWRTNAGLAGKVDINFKSDYFPLANSLQSANGLWVLMQFGFTSLIHTAALAR
jgi:hypothetical protein